MRLFDTHCHLDEEAFFGEVDDVVARGVDAGLIGLATIGIDSATSRAAVDLADRFATVHAVVGIQPNYVAESTEADWQDILELVTAPGVVAVGETGLDRYWDHTPIEQQAEMFRRHMQLAREHDLPFVVHCREAEADVVSELEREAAKGPLTGIMHSFAGDRAKVIPSSRIHLVSNGGCTVLRIHLQLGIHVGVGITLLVESALQPAFVLEHARILEGLSRSQFPLLRQLRECDRIGSN